MTKNFDELDAEVERQKEEIINLQSKVGEHIADIRNQGEKFEDLERKLSRLRTATASQILQEMGPGVLGDPIWCAGIDRRIFNLERREHNDRTELCREARIILMTKCFNYLHKRDLDRLLKIVDLAEVPDDPGKTT